MTPGKPFDTYKWRWLSVQPSESLLQAPIFLGVLRALLHHEGEAFSSTGLHDELATVQIATRSPVTLARNPIRNLFRNSGQYWRGTGLVAPEPGVVQLTTLGRRVAEGGVTQGEFAALMVQQTVLPNPATYSPEEIAKWQASGVRIRPLKLILEILEELGRQFEPNSPSLSNEELIEVVIPLAGIKASVPIIARHVIQYRRGRLNVSGWPDCAPEANDKRLAREFLLFLANFGLLRLDASKGMRDQQRFYLDELFDVDAATSAGDASIFADEASAEQAVDEVRHSPLPSIIERQRAITRVLARTGQSKFRSRIMKAYQGRCFLTGETIGEVLEAAHIVPVTNNGADHENNGFCMRVDIHRLYDSGNLRIRADGSLMLSDAVANSPNYKDLPKSINFPAFVNPANIIWRDSYL
ncbi:MAG TPA: HNH endonuclease signature motif containing protein [Allosphingosinicella sp.]|nr:HNH endonuclease signature motif containing protein [Allosphingosinicella sp.]